MAKQMLNISREPGKYPEEKSNDLLRKWDSATWKKKTRKARYDQSRTYLNFEVVKGGLVVPVNQDKSIPQRIKENIVQRGLPDSYEETADNHGHHIYADMTFGGSRDKMRELTFGDQEVDYSVFGYNHLVKRKPEIEQWAIDVYNFVVRKWGEENIVAFIVHVDERNPHAHCVLLTFNDTGKIMNKEFFGVPGFFSNFTKIHDELAEVNKKWGLERGDSAYVKGAGFSNLEDYAEVSLQKIFESTERETLWHQREKLCDLQEDEIRGQAMLLLRSVRDIDSDPDGLEEILKSDNITMEQLGEAIGFAKKRVTALTTMIKNRKGIINELGEAADLSQEEKKNKIESLDQDLKDTEYKIVKAQEQVDILQKKEREINNYLVEEAKNALDKDVEKERLIKGILVVEFVKGVQNIKLPPKPEGDPSAWITLKTLKEHAGDIVLCGVMMYSNLPEKAIDIAKEAGVKLSEGQIPKRHDDETDQQYVQRCFFAVYKAFGLRVPD